ncbi:Secreted RxLR effector peptide protein [Phytophthora palmivora]|uniref:RxLR effector protein n=1 Tax=Phytophthora palmivora TaxID=4796 RepID=A0A2P4YTM2_9STRA|nr:Secreted RxLR effector peptide protein [Phytophthora palmivora]
MRFYYIILAIFLTIVAIVDAAPVELKVTSFGFQTSTRSLATYPKDARDSKLLRTNMKVNENNEERAIVIPGLSKLKETFLKIKNWFVDFVSKIKTSYTERRQIRKWMKEEKTPDEVFVLLGLDKGIDGILASPKLRTWSVFMTTYNRKNPTKMVNMLGTLTKYYGDRDVAIMIETSRRDLYTRPLANKLQPLANKLQNHQLTAWILNGLSSDIVFQLLRVGEGSVKNLLQNKALNVWSYFFFRKNVYNTDREIQLMKKLLTVYDDIPLAKASEVAKRVERTEFMGTQLQNAQFKKWLADGVDPQIVLKRLEKDQSKWKLDPNTAIYTAYKTFYDANKK